MNDIDRNKYIVELRMLLEGMHPEDREEVIEKANACFDACESDAEAVSRLGTPTAAAIRVLRSYDPSERARKEAEEAAKAAEEEGDESEDLSDDVLPLNEDEDTDLPDDDAESVCVLCPDAEEEDEYYDEYYDSEYADYGEQYEPGAYEMPADETLNEVENEPEPEYVTESEPEEAAATENADLPEEEEPDTKDEAEANEENELIEEANEEPKIEPGEEVGESTAAENDVSEESEEDETEAYTEASEAETKEQIAAAAAIGTAEEIIKEEKKSAEDDFPDFEELLDELHETMTEAEEDADIAAQAEDIDYNDDEPDEEAKAEAETPAREPIYYRLIIYTILGIILGTPFVVLLVVLALAVLLLGLLVGAAGVLIVSFCFLGMTAVSDVLFTAGTGAAVLSVAPLLIFGAVLIFVFGAISLVNMLLEGGADYCYKQPEKPVAQPIIEERRWPGAVFRFVLGAFLVLLVGGGVAVGLSLLMGADLTRIAGTVFGKYDLAAVLVYVNNLLSGIKGIFG